MGTYLKMLLIVLIVTPISFFVTLRLLPKQVGSFSVLLTKGKQVTLSSYWADRKYPRGAIDGVINGKYSFSTKKEKNPWWQIDLEGVAAIDSIVIYNRTDCCMELAKNLRIDASEDGQIWKEIYVHDGKVFGGFGKLKPLSIKFSPPREGRYIRISLDDTNYLHLDEVLIKGQIVVYIVD